MFKNIYKLPEGVEPPTIRSKRAERSTLLSYGSNYVHLFVGKKSLLLYGRNGIRTHNLYCTWRHRSPIEPFSSPLLLLPT